MPTTYPHYEELQDILGCTPTFWSIVAAVNRYQRAFISVNDYDAEQLDLPICGEIYEETCAYWSQWLKNEERVRRLKQRIRTDPV
jgi:hypothetical protein